MAAASPSSRDPLIVTTLHPALAAEQTLLSDCDLVQTRRSGPGGQHRNKVATAIVLHHRPTGISAEASERRSQVDNRRVALRRLRESLCLQVRTQFADAGPDDGAASSEAQQQRGQIRESLRKKYGGGTLRLADDNEDRPAMLALMLDELWWHQGDLRPVAEAWNVSSSAVLRLVKSQPPALQSLNELRRAHDLRPLR